MSVNQIEIEGGAAQISLLIGKCLVQTNQGCLIGRNGTIELQTLLHWMKHGWTDTNALQVLERNAGVFPVADSNVVLDWIQEYFQANKDADCMAVGWYPPVEKAERELFATWNPSVLPVRLRSLEPYYVAPALRWTKLLAGQKVAVVSSFADTMKKQLAHREAVWGSNAESLLPSTTEFVFFKTGYAPSLALGRAGWSPVCRSWTEAVDRLEQEILASGARIVLIGCGGLGLPLGKRLRAAGKIVIVLGGAIQVLFGIKGNRWKNHDVISKFWNHAWVYPSTEETPAGASMIEASCYWA
jgi:hypothetical protein